MQKPPRDFPALCNEIIARRPNLSHRLQQIARFALEHPNEIALQTITMIASRIGVPPSAMIRFAKAIGYRGFSDMQAVFRLPLGDNLPDRQVAQLWPYESASAESPAPTASTVLEAILVGGGESLQGRLRNVSPARLERAVTLLVEKQNVYVVGQGYSFPVAAYLAHALTHLERHVHLLDSVGGMLQQHAGGMSDGDVLVAVSFPPYALETTELVGRAAARGASVIVLTDGPISPITGLAAVSLEVHEPEVHGFPTLTAMLCLTQALAAHTRLRLEAQSRIRKMAGGQG